MQQYYWKAITDTGLANGINLPSREESSSARLIAGEKHENSIPVARKDARYRLQYGAAITNHVRIRISNVHARHYMREPEQESMMPQRAYARACP